MSHAMGPFDSEQQARAAAHVIVPPTRLSILTTAENRQLLEDVCERAGVNLGAYDRRILLWLAGWEDATCAVVAGLITRAHEAARSNLTESQRTAVRVAREAVDADQPGHVEDFLSAVGMGVDTLSPGSLGGDYAEAFGTTMTRLRALLEVVDALTGEGEADG